MLNQSESPFLVAFPSLKHYHSERHGQLENVDWGDGDGQGGEVEAVKALLLVLLCSPLFHPGHCSSNTVNVLKILFRNSRVERTQNGSYVIGG